MRHSVHIFKTGSKKKKETSFADILTDTLLRSILFAGDQPA